jgi:hypothetical protein
MRQGEIMAARERGYIVSLEETDVPGPENLCFINTDKKQSR